MLPWTPAYRLLFETLARSSGTTTNHQNSPVMTVLDMTTADAASCAAPGAVGSKPTACSGATRARGLATCSRGSLCCPAPTLPFLLHVRVLLDDCSIAIAKCVLVCLDLEDVSVGSKVYALFLWERLICYVSSYADEL